MKSLLLRFWQWLGRLLGPGQLSAAFQRVIDANGGLIEKLMTLTEGFPDPLHTDYVVV